MRHFRTLTRSAALGCVLLLACLAAGEACAATEDRLEPLPDTTRPLHYSISVTPDSVNSRFTAHEVVKFEVLKPTSEVVVHSRGLTIDSAKVGAREAKISFDEKRQRALFQLGETLQPGVHELEVSWSGPIYGLDNQGLFKRTFLNADGTQGDALFTMLCCISTGRYFAPMWDQTADKAVFELELNIPAGLDAFSNMPIVSREPTTDGKVRVKFQPTPRMSTYLFYFAVGEFDQLRSRVGETDVGIVVRRGMGDRARYALDISLKSLAYYNDYFQLPFPLPKLDGIAVSGASGFGGMENFGAIAYSEEHMLDGPAWSSQSSLRDTHTLITHEIAHQWFGDIVTAQTWDGLWLNEGFANWMEKKATEHFHPEWNIWMQDAADNRESAMGFDARQASYAITPNHSFDDAITYNKSGQVIRMIEAYVGEDAFREAMRAHMKRRAFGNSVGSDIWEALENASDLPVAAIGRDFTEQKGVPLIDVVSTSCAAGSQTTEVVLRQDRFGLDKASRSRLEWHVPVTAAVAGSAEIARQVVTGAGRTTLNVPGCGPVKVNVADKGYFRTRYDAASFAKLEASLASLAPADQLGLLNDTLALGEGGYVPLDQYLDLAARVPMSADPLVLFQIAQSAQKLDAFLDGKPSREAYRALSRARLGAMLSTIGWDVRKDESLSAGILRGRLIEALGQLGDTATRVESLRRFRAADADPAVLAPQVREVVLEVVGMGADEAVFDDLVSRAASARTIEEKKRLLIAAAGAQDPQVAEKALQLTLSGKVSDEAVPPILLSVARAHSERAFDFVVANFAALKPKFGENVHEWLLPAIAANAYDARMERKLKAVAAKYIGNDGRHDVAGASSTILYRDEVRRKRMASVDAWVRRAQQEK